MALRNNLHKEHTVLDEEVFTEIEEVFSLIKKNGCFLVFVEDNHKEFYTKMERYFSNLRFAPLNLSNCKDLMRGNYDVINASILDEKQIMLVLRGIYCVINISFLSELDKDKVFSKRMVDILNYVENAIVVKVKERIVQKIRFEHYKIKPTLDEINYIMQ